jgi:hypothetical protein
MSKPPLSEAAVTMLLKANPSVITTLRPDGQPVATATWYLWDDGRVLVNMDEGRKRLEHMRADPRVSSTSSTRMAGTPTSASSATLMRSGRTRTWPTSTASPGSTRVTPTRSATAAASAPGLR